MHRDEKRIPGSRDQRGEGVLAGLFCAFVCFSSSPLFLVFLSLVLLFFCLMFCPCSSLLQFVFLCSLSLITPGLPLFYPIFSPVSVSCSSSLPLSLPSLAVFFFLSSVIPLWFFSFFLPATLCFLSFFHVLSSSVLSLSLPLPLFPVPFLTSHFCFPPCFLLPFQSSSPAFIGQRRPCAGKW